VFFMKNYFALENTIHFLLDYCVNVTTILPRDSHLHSSINYYSITFTLDQLFTQVLSYCTLLRKAKHIRLVTYCCINHFLYVAGADWHYNECGSATEACPQNCFGVPVWWSMGTALTPLPPLFGGRSIFAGRQISSTFRKISGAGPWFATLLKGSQSAPD